MSDILMKLEAIIEAKSLLNRRGVGDNVITLKCDNVNLLEDFCHNERRYEQILNKTTCIFLD